jgi:lipoyl(octanoyl) transferase
MQLVMHENSVAHEPSAAALQAFLLGVVEFDAIQRMQRRLVYEIAGDRSMGALVLCEHPPLITVGRNGSREHIRFEPADLALRGWAVRWVNRGGGCLLHLPGQIAAYSIVALDSLKLDVREYLDRLHDIVLDVLDAVGVVGQRRPSRAGVWAGDRLLAHVGIAVRDWIAYFGLTVNIGPDLDPFRRVWCAGPHEPPMTSLERERRSHVRVSTVRQRMVEAFTNRLGFARAVPFHSHPALGNGHTRSEPSEIRGRYSEA